MAEYDRKTARQKIDMVSFRNLAVEFLEAHRRGSGGPAGGGISQNVHTPAILYPPTGRKIVVSYMHSQEPRAARPWPGTGGEICHPRACSAAGRLCILPPGCGGRQTTPRPRVLNIKREKSARSWYQLRADLRTDQVLRRKASQSSVVRTAPAGAFRGQPPLAAALGPR